MSHHKVLTTNFGKPVEDDQNTLTAGHDGPALIQDVHLFDKMAHFNRERIPERVVHAKGAGAYGYFETTNDLSKYTKANFLSQVGKRTEAFVRFSTVGGEKGSADAARDPRGFALKLYTEEGNYDLVMNNTPVFFIRDPLKFPDFIHTQKRHPATNLHDPDMFWDFLSLTPESIHQVTILFSDRGTPENYRRMNGYGGHTFKWYNDNNECVWVKYHFTSEQGIGVLNRDQATRISGEDADHATRDLYQAIDKGQYPSWKVTVQIMTADEAGNSRFNPFDLTKVWFHKDFPEVELGRLVLNKNPQNYFADVEQAAFSPGNFVPGIAASPDKMLQGRLFAYHDAHRHRLGSNYHALPVNAAKAASVSNYQRDGFMRFDDNSAGAPNYYPNSFGGPAPMTTAAEPPFELTGSAMREPYAHPNDDYVQPGALYRRVMTDGERTNLVGNIIAHLGGAQTRIQFRQAALFYKADPEYGTKVAEGLGLKVSKVAELADMEDERRAELTAG